MTAPRPTASSVIPTPTPSRWRWRPWMGAVVVVAIVALIVVMSTVVHPRLARALFGSGALSPGAIYAILTGAAGLTAILWFAVAMNNGGGVGSTASRARLGAAVTATLACMALISPPGRTQTEHWREGLTQGLGWVLGHTEAVAAITVTLAVLPTMVVAGFLVWRAQAGGRLPTVAAYGLLACWLVAVAVTGWALGAL